MRLISVFLVAAATLVACGAAVSAGADSEQTRSSTAVFPDVVQSVDTASQKRARFLRSSNPEEEERASISRITLS
ncbi:hypothetical protein PI124_g18591 [Phytophthora idaei]|nr:hypothetical protein PI125_g21676 [Phytophthora idaei]KAG3131474.1 hypothetical protein PI126_g20042 [Phytophthora idaei]KAG3236398.1 hypothetical protein PI124_g18591 [Phytophthora idaei]